MKRSPHDDSSYSLWRLERGFALAIVGLYVALLLLVLVMAVGGSVLAAELERDGSLLVAVALGLAAVALAGWLWQRGRYVISRVLGVLLDWAVRVHRAKP